MLLIGVESDKIPLLKQLYKRLPVGFIYASVQVVHQDGGLFLVYRIVANHMMKIVYNFIFCLQVPSMVLCKCSQVQLWCV